MPRNQQQDSTRHTLDPASRDPEAEGRDKSALSPEDLAGDESLAGEARPDYGAYVENDEGDSSVRAGAYDEGRRRGGRDAREQQARDTREQSGSTGRFAGYGGRGDRGAGYSGQERYGQSGYGQGGYGQRDGEYRGGTFGQGPTGTRGDYGGYVGDTSAAGEDHPGRSHEGDERLRALISERLREDPHIDASGVSVSVEDGRVTFDGTVDSGDTKNLVADVAEQFGCEDVRNNLRVQRQGAGDATADR